jgi:hypothetical protein
LLGGGAGEELQGIEEVKGGGLAVRRWGRHLGHVWTADGRVGLEGVEPKGRRKKKKKKKKKKKDVAKAKAADMRKEKGPPWHEEREGPPRHEEGEGPRRRGSCDAPVVGLGPN